MPQLLDKEEPELTKEFRPEACLHFRYHYPILPEGLLPRFIVRTNALSEGLPRWRTGVVLEFEGNRALVKADVQDKIVFIAVAGPISGRRRLLAVIRSDFDQIHASIRRIKPQAMVPVPGRPQLVVPYQKLMVLEQKGRRTFEEVIGDEVLDLDVAELLDGIDLAGSRRRSDEKVGTDTPLRLFFSYSHKDERFRNELGNHLKILERLGLIASWYDRLIRPGQDWADVIDENLKRADLILLLVSAASSPRIIAMPRRWNEPWMPRQRRGHGDSNHRARRELEECSVFPPASLTQGRQSGEPLARQGYRMAQRER